MGGCGSSQADHVSDSGRHEDENSPYKKKKKKLRKKKSSLSDVSYTDMPFFLRFPPTKEEKEQILLDMTKEEKSNYRAAFNYYDKNNNGTIDRGELILVMRTLGENPTEDQLNCIMYEMDEDGSGKIEFDEFIVSMALRKKMRDSLEDLKMAFQLFDKDGDGTIRADELVDVLTTITGTMTAAEADEFMSEADKDGNGYIDYQEFVQMMQSDEADENVSDKNSQDV